jgi:aminobenzoyl-glutamate transport protein
MNPNLSIGLASNLWFSIASVLLLAVAVSLITDRMIEPRLGAPSGAESNTVTPQETRGLKFAVWWTLAILAFFALLTLPPGAPLRNEETGALIGAGTMKGTKDIIKAMEKAVAGNLSATMTS